MSEESTVEITHDTARDESVCGVFCDAEPEVSFEAFGYTFHWCRDCYEGPCGRCHEPIPQDTRGSTRAKGWCEDCREEVKLLCGDDDRGIQKDDGEEQAKLLTDGGRDTAEAPQRDSEPLEVALSNVREALAAVQNVPAVALDEQKAEQLRCAVDDLGALESALSHETNQQRAEDSR